MADASSRSPEPIDLSESVAGEEDPGASVDLAVRPAAASGAPTPQPMAPGDEAPPGTPGTGEDLCRTCGGSGQLNSGPCPECEGTGRVTRGIGGA